MVQDVTYVFQYYGEPVSIHGRDGNCSIVYKNTHFTLADWDGTRMATWAVRNYDDEAFDDLLLMMDLWLKT